MNLAEKIDLYNKYVLKPGFNEDLAEEGEQLLDEVSYADVLEDFIHLIIQLHREYLNLEAIDRIFQAELSDFIEAKVQHFITTYDRLDFEVIDEGLQITNKPDLYPLDRLLYISDFTLDLLRKLQRKINYDYQVERPAKMLFIASCASYVIKEIQAKVILFEAASLTKAAY